MENRINADQVLHSTMMSLGLERADHQVDIEGERWGTVKARQNEEIQSELPKFAKEQLKEHIIEYVAKHLLDWEIGVTGHLVAAGPKTIAAALDTIEEGDQLNDAVKREYALGAALMLCADVLPEGYRAEICGEFFKKGSVSPGGIAVYETIRNQPGGAEIQKGFTGNCQDGQRYALEHRIADSGELHSTLRQNPAFADRYEHDITFRMGVDSVLWAAAHGAKSAIEQKLPELPQARLEVRG